MTLALWSIVFGLFWIVAALTTAPTLIATLRLVQTLIGLAAMITFMPVAWKALRSPEWPDAEQRLGIGIVLLTAGLSAGGISGLVWRWSGHQDWATDHDIQAAIVFTLALGALLVATAPKAITQPPSWLAIGLTAIGLIFFTMVLIILDASPELVKAIVNWLVQWT